ncbi:hypothetical protein AB0B12_30045 [Streptomyces sp. NPDC044780]|uniref:Uncharacterized protein n=1 Tax=Streptomyces luomodiensis TaxID=3026192 RepID=A0ABY9V5E8_9ACTN|nr:MULTISPECIES: hypothetical protein [unclassified Streptomyces]WAP59525.1 hypothetical protein N6H00_33800 [Streptomyces sp. S465]WNF00098.1 hypothetical protein PS467_34660 [Streptomyces sp. SCA4-21]
MRPTPPHQPALLTTSTTDQANEAIRVFLRARGGRALRPSERAEYSRLLRVYTRALRGEMEQAA